MSSALTRWSLKLDDIQQLPFRELRPGVEIHVLHDTPEGARAALLRYAPGAEVPAHVHTGHEYICVLDGEQRDERGSYAAGTFVINEPGAVHRVQSPGGCCVLILWERPVTFL
jgi:anti-sigma factor ChrR (cupin superfamily)